MSPRPSTPARARRSATVTARPASLALVPPAPDEATEGLPRASYDHFLADGELVKPGSTLAPIIVPVGTAVDPARLRAEIDAARALQRRATAKTTRRSYGWHTRQWIDWCDARDIDPLSDDPVWVAVHLANYAAATGPDGQPIEADDGSLVRGHSVSSVEQRLAAINKFHEYAGKPRPGESIDVKAVIAGIRREFHVRHEYAKHAICAADLKRLLAATDGSQAGALRDTAILLLRCADLTAGQIATLSWTEIDLHPDRVVVTAAATCHNGEPATFTLPRHPDARIDPVRVLTALQALAPTLGWVFPGRPGGTGNPHLTRQAVTNLLNLVADVHGGYAGLPGLPAEVRAEIVASLSAHESGKGYRDRAVLAGTWMIGQRRSSMVALDWRDLERTNDGWRVLIRRSKTDQEGHGTTQFLPQVPEGAGFPIPCPATLLDEWHTWLTRELGQDPRTLNDGRVPVFVRFGPHGMVLDAEGVPERMSGAALNELIQDLAIKAGLTKKPRKGERNPYGAHSLRAGFVTEMLDGDKMPAPDIQQITGHKSLDMLIRYYRPKPTAANSPVARLIRQANAV